MRLRCICAPTVQRSNGSSEWIPAYSAVMSLGKVPNTFSQTKRAKCLTNMSLNVTRWVKTRHFTQILNLRSRQFYPYRSLLRLLHQRVTGGLHSIVLNYEARLCYYNDDISSNSRTGRPVKYGNTLLWTACTRFRKTRFYQLPVCIRLFFCP